MLCLSLNKNQNIFLTMYKVSKNSIDLSVDVAGIRLKNPLIAASGTFGYGDEITDLFSPEILGGFVLKGLTFKPKAGNLPPRIVETPSGLVNSIGLQNIGVENFLKTKASFLKRINTVIIANIAGESIEENIAIVKTLESEKYIKIIELNVSCPNVNKGGISFGTDIKSLTKLVSSIKRVTNKRLMVKLSPLVSNIELFAKVCEENGADIISAINTIPAMVIDVKSQKPFLGNKTGGLSGPAIRPVGVRTVWQIYKKIKIPIVGCGGITSANDALEYILAGAVAVQIGTSMFSNYKIFNLIISELKEYLVSIKERFISNLTGRAHNE